MTFLSANTIIPATALCFTLASFASVATSFQTQVIKLDHPANGHLLKLQDNPTLLVTGHNIEHRWLSQVDLTLNQASQIAIPTTAQFFDQALLAGQKGGQLVSLTTEGVAHYQVAEKRWRKLLSSSSLYRVVDTKRLRRLEFSHDLNKDQLSDFLLPDFNGYQLWLQQTDGSFRHFELAIDSQMQAFDEDPTYIARKPWLVDLNLDGKTDIAFAKDDSLQVFLQQADGSFPTSPLAIALGVGLTPDNQAQLRSGDGRSFKGLTITRLQQLADINGDNVVDLVVQQQQYVDAMEQNYSYHIYYGQQGATGVSFQNKPSQTISTSGVQFDVKFVDLDNDKRVDFYTPAAQIGVRSIIRALIAGTANVELQFYKQQADGSFGKKPVYQQDMTVEISIGSGQVNMPLATVLKNAAGVASLVVGDGEDTLRTFAPAPAKLFSEKSTKQQQPMPKRGVDALVVDLNGDGKEDLVLPFTSQEADPELTNQLQLLIQQ
ncbi:MAG: VCBS repeat-containing protein [Gammaproteobacteria bacterium]|nr:VCBS repeat-containing protein [Gammaproteobacteria bacterium]